ncbi:MAG TPA: glycosyl hydrolase family 28-related protein [Actinomadura sp.]|nr:glycosyl hydrolase family 28-related protein [Actinomadura sp.]
MEFETSRRDFLRVAGTVTGGVIVAGAVGTRPAHSATPAASPWDQVPAILARTMPPTFPARDFDITDYGAKGDDTTGCTLAFRRAIAVCNALGGGRVVVPAGTFRTGRIHLLSNVNLHVTSGGTIRFRSDAASYLPMVYTRWQGIECFNYSPFIYAYDQVNVAITGPGTIDGNAQNGSWFDFDGQRGPDWDRLQQMAVDGVPVDRRRFGDGHFLKPNMIQLYRCRNILISDVSLRNPAMWTVHPVLSRNVTVRNVKTNNRRGGVVDGIHVRDLTGGPCDRGGLYVDMDYSLTGPGYGV